MSVAGSARRYLRAHRHGVLATISKKLGGYPFGSVVPFVLDHAAHPVILIKYLAEHTRNIAVDPRVSLLVHDTAADVQAAARLTLVGDARRCGDAEALRARYLRYLPDAARLFEIHDFSFYRIVPRTLRFIGGFGDIHWVRGEDYAPPANRLDAQEDAILAHMNADHAHNLRDYCRHFGSRAADAVEMIGLDCDGFDLRAGAELVRLDFSDPVTDADEARRALVAMAREAREARA